jgi:hypothetical protein
MNPLDLPCTFPSPEAATSPSQAFAAIAKVAECYVFIYLGMCAAPPRRRAAAPRPSPAAGTPLARARA